MYIYIPGLLPRYSLKISYLPRPPWSAHSRRTADGVPCGVLGIRDPSSPGHAIRREAVADGGGVPVLGVYGTRDRRRRHVRPLQRRQKSRFPPRGMHPTRWLGPPRGASFGGPPGAASAATTADAGTCARACLRARVRMHAGLDSKRHKAAPGPTYYEILQAILSLLELRILHHARDTRPPPARPPSRPAPAPSPPLPSPPSHPSPLAPHHQPARRPHVPRRRGSAPNRYRTGSARLGPRPARAPPPSASTAPPAPAPQGHVCT